MARTKGMVPILILAMLGFAVLMFSRAPAASLPSLTAPVAHHAARGQSALADMDLDVAGAEGHAVTNHGDVARRILDAAKAGQCTTMYLECGADRNNPADGTKGYLVCPLSDGGLGLVPFYVDALVGRLVAMTAYPIRPGYERYVAQRDGCIPVELLSVWLTDGGIYGINDNQ